MEADDYALSIDVSPVRPGRSSRGSKTVDMILQAAAHVLIEEGSASFTLRRVAAECNLQLGNVTRHFPRKEMLVQLLLHESLTSSEEHVERLLYGSKMSAEEALTVIIVGTLDDIKTRRTTRLMTELWAMSNHNKFVAERVDQLYQYYHNLLGRFIKQLNPALDDSQVETLAVFINATTEGMTVLAGHGKSWESRMPLMKPIAVKSLVHLVKTISPDEIQRL